MKLPISLKSSSQIAIIFFYFQIYRVNNVRIALVMVETWSSGDKISVVADSSTTLASFRTYKNTVLDTNDDTKNHDNAHLLTYVIAF